MIVRSQFWHTVSNAIIRLRSIRYEKAPGLVRADITTGVVAMTNQNTRSPFGELVYALRKKRGWTQARLAREAPSLRPMADARMQITERTIRNIERRATSPSDWTKPRQDTVAAL